MKKLMILFICLFFLTGCSSTIGKVANVEFKKNNRTVIQFEDGRLYTFINCPTVPIHEGEYITIEYTETVEGTRISSITNHTGHTSENCPATKYKLTTTRTKKSHKSESDIIMCPRCQYTLEEGTDY